MNLRISKILGLSTALAAALQALSPCIASGQSAMAQQRPVVNRVKALDILELSAKANRIYIYDLTIAGASGKRLPRMIPAPVMQIRGSGPIDQAKSVTYNGPLINTNIYDFTVAPPSSGDYTLIVTDTDKHLVVTNVAVYERKLHKPSMSSHLGY